MTDAAWEMEYAAFLRRLAEHQGRALAGDEQARQIVNEYGLCRWAGHHPIAALAVAESFVR
jgi:hypothetical protein